MKIGTLSLPLSQSRSGESSVDLPCVEDEDSKDDWLLNVSTIEATMMEYKPPNDVLGDSITDLMKRKTFGVACKRIT